MTDIFEGNGLYGACLLHRTYHEMVSECCNYAAAWLINHQDSWSTWYKPQAYVGEWEARLLRDALHAQ